MKPAASFADITKDKVVQSKLEKLYGTVENVEGYVGIFAEDRDYLSVGLPYLNFIDLITAVFSEMFYNLDSVYYEDSNRFPSWVKDEIAVFEPDITLYNLITKNTNIKCISKKPNYVPKEPLNCF